MKTGLREKNISEILATSLSLAFYVLLLVELIALMQDSTARLLVILVSLPFFLVTLLRSYWGVWTFVAAVPLVNGLLLLKGFGCVSLAFAGVYLAWLPKQLIAKKRLKPLTPASFFADLLAAVVLLNVLLFLARIVDGPLPSQDWISWFAFFPFVGQGDNLWQLNAALTLLKGIFLFKIIEGEVRDRDSWIMFTRTLYVQAVLIAGFSFAQFVSFRIRGEDYLGLYLPFNDIHSFGSYGVLLLVTFASLFMRGPGPGDTAEVRRPGSREGNDRKLSGSPDAPEKKIFLLRWSPGTAVNGLLALCFLLVCVFSSSRVTWLVMGASLLLLGAAQIKSRKMFAFVGIAIIAAALAGSQFAGRMIQSGDPSSSMYRLGSLLHVNEIYQDKSLLVRFELWGRSMAMVEEFPLTGVGAGNFYGNSVHYKKRDLRKWDVENAHNYYLQLAAELGIPGAVLFLLILFSLYFHFILCQRTGGEARLPQVSIRPYLFGAGAYLATMMTGHPLLLSSQQFLFWAILAIISTGQAAAAGEKGNQSTGTALMKKAGVLLFLLYVAGFGMNVLKKEPWTIPVEYGLYPAENWNGEYMRWMAGKAEYSLPRGTGELSLKVVAQPFNSQGPEGLTLSVSINDSVVDEVRFLDGGEAILRYDIPPVNGRDIIVNLQVDRVFSPARIGLNDDIRTLGVALGPAD